MRKLLVALIAVIGLTATAALADDRDFTVVNDTGYPIKFIGVNAPGDNNWNENELNGIMAHGGTVNVKFTKGDKGCTWNMVVGWEGYDSAVLFTDMDLCKISKVTLRYDRDSKVTSYAWE